MLQNNRLVAEMAFATAENEQLRADITHHILSTSYLIPFGTPWHPMAPCGILWHPVAPSLTNSARTVFPKRLASFRGLHDELS